MGCCLKAFWDQLLRSSDFIPDSASEGLDSFINIWVANTDHCVQIHWPGSSSPCLVPKQGFWHQWDASFFPGLPSPIITLYCGFEMSFWCPLLRKLWCMKSQFSSPDSNQGKPRGWEATGLQKLLPLGKEILNTAHIWSLGGASLLEKGLFMYRAWQFEWLCKCHSLKIKMKLSVNSNRSKLKSRVKHLFHEHNSLAVFDTSKWYLFSKW